MERQHQKKSITAKFTHLIAACSLTVFTGHASAAEMNQPIGYIAPVAVTSPGVSGDGTLKTKIITPWFDANSWAGELSAYEIKTDDQGTTTGEIGTISWSAMAKLNAADWDARKIFTRSGISSAGVAFRWANLNSSEKTAVGTEAVLNYIRGDRTSEVSVFRQRASVLGDIIRSNPVYVDEDKLANPPISRVYIGGNDGALHAFNAATGDEVFAYIPGQLLDKLSLLTDFNYNLSTNGVPQNHQHYVDGKLSVGDIQTFDAVTSQYVDRKILVGGLGSGGVGYFALNISDTSPTKLTSEAEAAKLLMWETHNTDTGLENMAFSYSKPLIVKLNTSTYSSPKWGVIVGNGYIKTDGASTGTATLVILDAETGALIKEIDTNSTGSVTNPTGLSTPTAIDTDFDGTADHVFAGDLNGKLWKFDISSKVSTSEWAVASLGGTPGPMYQAQELDNAQPQVLQNLSITTAPRVVPHINGGAWVIFATGRMLSQADMSDATTINGIFAVHDKFNGSVIDSSASVVQEFTADTFSGVTPIPVRIATKKAVPAVKDVWKIMLPAGERVVTTPLIADGRVSFTSANPTSIPSATTWYTELNYNTGGQPIKTIFDMDNNGLLNSGDNISINGDPTGVVVSIYGGNGIASEPILADISSLLAKTYINRLQYTASGSGQTVQTTIQNLADEVTVYPPAVIPPTTPGGLTGGHFDVDTTLGPLPATHDIATSTGGGGNYTITANTDEHTHEYDDKCNVTYVDAFNLNMPCIPGDMHKNITDIPADKLFKLVVVNGDLSKGANIHIDVTDPLDSTADIVDYVNKLAPDYDDSYIAANGQYIKSGKNIKFRNLTDVYTTGTAPTVKGKAKPTDAKQLSGLRVSFDINALMVKEAGGPFNLHPTETGCMQDNLPGNFGEWRNGALTIFAIEVKKNGDPAAPFITDSTNTNARRSENILWEMNLFWHWFQNNVPNGQDGCYNPENYAVWSTRCPMLETDPTATCSTTPTEPTPQPDVGTPPPDSTTSTSVTNPDGSTTVTTVVTTSVTDPTTGETTTTKKTQIRTTTPATLVTTPVPTKPNKPGNSRLLVNPNMSSWKELRF